MERVSRKAGNEAVREHGIIMSAPMVKALLDGSKTQTRRMVKPLPTVMLPNPSWVWNGKFYSGLTEAVARCPYGVASDRLWVRETHRLTVVSPHFSIRSCVVQYRSDNEELYRYECDHASLCIDDLRRSEKWKPSIFMPRWASRITLEITGVRVERLQDISEEDAVSEGIQREKRVSHWAGEMSGTAKIMHGSAIRAYAWLWESLHGKGAWELNPWVWVLEFKRA